MAIPPLKESSDFLDISGAILIGQTIYPKTSESHARLLDAIVNVGYTLNEEQNSAQFDESKLKHTVKCYHCGFVQDDCTGVCVTHNFPCESCAEPLNVDYERDATVEFKFVRNDIVDDRLITLRIFDYDMKTEELIFFPEPKLDVFSMHNPEDVLRDNQDRYTRRMVDVDGHPQELIAIPVRNSPFMDPADHIRKSHVSGGKYYHTGVTVFMGVAYDDHDDLPIPMSISISTEFMDSKLDLKTPNAHEIILSIAGLSSRTSFYDNHWTLEQAPIHMERMNVFVKNFVDVDFKEWEEFISAAPKKRAYFINALAKWCALQSDGVPREVNTTTNFMNAVHAAKIQIAGGELDEEIIAQAYEGLDHLGKLFGTVVTIQDVNPHDLMETVHTVLNGQKITKLISTEQKPKDAESGPL